MLAIKRIVWFCLLGLMVWSVKAQATPIEVGAVIEASIESDGVHTYTWTALEATLVSIRVESLVGTLDPVLRVLDSSGNVVVSNDDYDYPDVTTALIQTFVVPRTDTYTIEVESFGDSYGEYILRLLPGYDVLATVDVATASSDWRSSSSGVISSTAVNERLFVELEGIAESGYLIADHFAQEATFYYEASFSEITATTNWQIGVVFQYVSPSAYYRLLLNDQGFYKIEQVVDETVTEIRAWSTHPAIVAGVSQFTLGILMSPNVVNVVYNGQVVGSVNGILPEVGQVGVMAVTANAFASRVTFILDGALMTVPTLVDDRLIFPEVLVGQNMNAIASLLERQQVIPAGGQLIFNAPQSEVRNVGAGVSRLTVASNTQFSQFVMGGTLTISTLGDQIGGCGLTFDETQPDFYTLAYINRAGEYGVSRRMGDTFEVGIFGDDLIQRGASYSIVLIVLTDQIYLYIDARLVGTMSYSSMQGSIGTAVVNFDGVDTTCTFNDLWLWTWETS